MNNRIPLIATRIVIAVIVVLCGAIVVMPWSAEAATRVRPVITHEASFVHRLNFSIAIPDLANTRHGGVDYYTVEYGRNQDLPNPNVVTIEGDQTSFSLSNLRSARKYYIRVQAFYMDGEESWLVYNEAWTKPNRPRFLKARNIQPTEVEFKWTKPYRTPWYTRYEVKWYTVNVDENGTPLRNKRGRKTGTLVGEEFLYTYKIYTLDVNNLEPNTRYFYKVRARILNKTWSNWSERKFFITKDQ